MANGLINEKVLRQPRSVAAIALLKSQEVADFH
jgi:hypothetical protein